MDDEQEAINLNEEEAAGATAYTDDGCDWSAWLKWKMRSRSCIRSGVYEPEPERPQVVPATRTPKKKPTKRRHKGGDDE